MKTNLWSILFVSALAFACGRKGSSGNNNSSTPTAESDAEASIPGQRGPQGIPGSQGEQGSQGQRGEDGTPGAGIVLFDAADRVIGYKFAENGDIADVFLEDGKRARIDMNTGELKAPLFNFFCLYESADCTGSCYVYDKRWLNTVILNADNSTMVAPRGAANLGGKTFQSYMHDQNACTVNNIVTLESYQAQSYMPDIAIPTMAPLYWGISP